jgi:murein DD-endopeptidase MepM/ murein hydrolase activator NlpD
MLTMISSRRLARVGVAVLVALLVAGLATPARSASEEEVERARQAQQEAAAARAAALGDLEEAAAAYEALNGEYQIIVFSMGQMRSRIDAYQAQAREARDQIRRRAVEAYMRGPEQEAAGLLLESGLAQENLVARHVLARAVAEEAASLSSLEAITVEMERLEVELEEETGRAAEMRIEAEAVAARMYELLAARDEELAAADETLQGAEAALAEQRRREEEERRRQEAIRQALLGPAGGVPDEVTPGFICPVAGSSVFVDSWGAPRPGGRVHTGTDLMGIRGTPLVAVADGTIQLGSNSVGGNTVWLYADHGVAYFYAHLDGFAAVSSGQWVSRGTVIGYMGDTGNPAPGAYHLHFGISPNGMGAVNPYPTLARHCN